ncbi:16S rRNA (cytosine(967)-C(5))-methyltransferase [Synechococcus sp. Nb3U1]|uniref:16S rRNA (cytosine(967)-C(5))-methyltransferase n=1 Tax=Synechococcus sp. Nb3U1 TaxID=1914529 RepID=UPI001F3A75B0|nr:16S rRNA (cytosine(967)-C(5))-methyltransferase [Synechococcus sp. Nb3U1]MCF2970477.1 16S rRNA (cytosine(967)-C(5))-methyltransferase [Synechococcus sp. Nb3U1]
MNARQLALLALQKIERQKAYADRVLGHLLQGSDLIPAERHLATELVYGITRRRRTLDALLERFSQRPAHKQPPDLRLILQMGLYQLAFLDQIPASAAIHTSVELARQMGLGSLTGVVNGILRAYQRQALPEPERDPLQPLRDTQPADPIQALGILHSFPDWLVSLWWERLGSTETEQLCQWFNQPPHLDLRINPLRAAADRIRKALAEAGIPTTPIPEVPGALRLQGHAGEITALPGFAQGWWTVQDASAQQVVHWLDPQPGERVIDCCAAPGGKTTHIAEQMQDQGEIWGLDRYAHRLKRLEENAHRLGLTAIRSFAVDLLELTSVEKPPAPLPVWNSADRVLVDAPCSGLGTLHRHTDARWRQTPDEIKTLAQLQTQLLDVAARWVKPEGLLVYATCTLHPAENEQVIETFLQTQPGWTAEGDPLLIWPHRQDRDGFFGQRLRRHP